MSSNHAACAAQFVHGESSCEQGLCSNVTGGCECFQGWTNVGDFSFNPLGSCDINVNAIVGLWAAQLVICGVSLLYALRILRRRHRHGVLFDRKTWRIGFVPFGQLIGCGVLIPVGVLKIIDNPQYAVGKSIPVVILTSIYVNVMAFSLLCGLMVLMKTSMALLPSQSEQLFELQRYYRSLKHITIGLAVVGFILCWSPVIMLFNKDLTYISAILLGIGLGSMMLLIGSGIGSLFINRLITGIDETLENAKRMNRTDTPNIVQLKKVYLKLRVARYFEVIGFTLASLILLIFCFTPILVKKASYLYPLAFIAGLLAVDILMWSHQNSTRSVSTNRGSTTGTLELNKAGNGKVGDVTDPGVNSPQRDKRGSLTPLGAA